MPSTIEFQGIVKRFGQVTALHEFTLSVRPGEFLALVGPSGCGKTTSLRILAGLETATSGRVLLDGADITATAAKDRDLAMVFQTYALYPHMTVAANIGFALELRRVQRVDAEAATRRAAERLGIGDLLGRYPRELSGGQRQRVAVARAIVRDPRAFLFDEPLSNLDAKLRVSARAELRRLQRDLGTTTVYVTHDQAEAMTMADRIVVMSEGRIEQVGPPVAVYDAPATLFVAGFLGSPPMNLWPVEIVAGAVRAGPVPLAPGTVMPGAIVGIRPEHIHLDAGNAASPLPIPARVTLIETLGAETLLHAETSGGSIVARLQGRIHGVTESETTILHADLSRLHAFDPAGRRMSTAPGLSEAPTPERLER
ncbi:MAG: ABC transporter ATP-binding protein [Acetobacteraceae bacterium]